MEAAFRLVGAAFVPAVLRASLAVILGEIFNCWGSHFTFYAYFGLWKVLLLNELLFLVANRLRDDLFFRVMGVMTQVIYLFSWLIFMEMGRLLDSISRHYFDDMDSKIN